MRRPAVFDHPRDEGLDPVDDAPEVDAEQPFPLTELEFPRCARQLDAGVVAQEVDRAEALRGPPREHLDVLPLRHIGGDREHVRGFADKRRRRLEPVRVDVGHHDAHPLFREPARQREPDAARRTCDDSRSPDERVHQGEVPDMHFRRRLRRPQGEDERRREPARIRLGEDAARVGARGQEAGDRFARLVRTRAWSSIASPPKVKEIAGTVSIT